MNRIRRSLLSFCLVLFLAAAGITLTPGEEVEAAVKVIVIDPGHDNIHARGACTISGIVEEEQNYAVAKSLKKQLEDAGYKVYLTHNGSCPVGSGHSNSECLNYRVSYAKSVGCDLYVSIHQNASGLNDNQWRDANGSYIYIASQYQSSLSSLAGKISTNLKNNCGMAIKTPNGCVQLSENGLVYSNGDPADYLQVIRKSTMSGFPSLLIEHGYMDNKHDAGQIKSISAYYFAKSDADAIISWLNSGSSSGSSSGSQKSGSSLGSMGYVNASTLNLRSSASTSASVVAKLSRNDTITLFECSNGWYRAVAFHGGSSYSGYVSADYVASGTPSGATGGGTAYVSSKTLNLRTSPSTSGSKVALLSSGDSLKIFENVNGWYRVIATHQGAVYNGYVSGDYITGSKGSSAAGTTNQASSQVQTTYSSTGFVKSDTVNLRSKASTSSSVVTTLVRFDGVDITAKEGNWYKVSAHHNGKTYSGYVCADYITTGSYGKVGYVNYTYLNVRSGCGVNYEQIDRIYYQDQVMVIGTNGSWYQIKYYSNGSIKTGCVSKDYISF